MSEYEERSRQEPTPTPEAGGWKPPEPSGWSPPEPTGWTMPQPAVGTPAGAGAGAGAQPGGWVGSGPTPTQTQPQVPVPGYGGSGGYGPPGYSAPPPWGAPTPAPSPAPRSGGRFLAGAVLLVLMGLSALAGGAAGAWIYARNQGPGADGAAAGVTVVDAPQLNYTSLASIASEVSPSVVQIRAGEGSGSGVVMSEDGYILTNAHVVAVATGNEVSVRFSDGETASATIVGADARSDIAVVRVDGASDLTAARFGDSDQALVGDTVLAIGSPLGFQGSVTQGILSARDRTLPVGGGPGQLRSLSGLLQTDASINPGNSGGPLVNLAGEVIGVNTAIATDGEAAGFLGLGFAVPSNRATDVAQQLIAGQEVSHAFLGVSVTTVETGGALIGEIAPGSPADQAGLREGDIVTRVDDQPIADSSDLVNTVQSAAPGDTLELQFERDGQQQTVSVTLAEIDD